MGTLTRTTGSMSGSGHEVTGIYSINQGSLATSLGYQLTFTGANYTISPRPLAVTAAAQSKVYDGTSIASATLNDNHISGDALTTSFANAGFLDPNAGTGKTVNVTGISLHGADAGDYSLLPTSVTTSADITAKPIVVSAASQSKVYGSPDPGSLVQTLCRVRSPDGRAKMWPTALTRSRKAAWQIRTTPSHSTTARC
jgi:hypothetical protein